MKARELALRHGMRNYDAIHLAHAITAGADVLMTVDQGFPLDSAVEGVWSTLRELVGTSRSSSGHRSSSSSPRDKLRSLSDPSRSMCLSRLRT